jgi:hypothetical protein
MKFIPTFKSIPQFREILPSSEENRIIKSLSPHTQF